MGKFTKQFRSARPAGPEPDAETSQPDGSSAHREEPVASSSKATDAAAPSFFIPEAPEDETKGHLLQRHKREAKLLKEHGKKLGKKHKEEADRLQSEMDKRHEAEVAALTPEDAEENGENAPVTLVAPTDGLYSLSLGTEAAKKKPTKAQKRREKAAEAEAAREARIADANAELGDSDRVLEERALAELLAPLGVGVRDITADGNCMYRAVEDQLALAGSAPAPDHAELRRQAAAFMRAHPDDFLPYLPQDGDETGGENPEEAYGRYCDEVEGTAAWGGQLELGALCRVLRHHITVHAVGQPPVEMGEEFKGGAPSLRVCHLRHAYGLGDHYNSVAPLDKLGIPVQED